MKELDRSKNYTEICNYVFLIRMSNIQTHQPYFSTPTYCLATHISSLDNSISIMHCANKFGPLLRRIFENN